MQAGAPTQLVHVAPGGAAFGHTPIPPSGWRRHPSSSSPAPQLRPGASWGRGERSAAGPAARTHQYGVARQAQHHRKQGARPPSHLALRAFKPLSDSEVQPFLLARSNHSSRNFLEEAREVEEGGSGSSVARNMELRTGQKQTSGASSTPSLTIERVCVRRCMGVNHCVQT